MSERQTNEQNEKNTGLDLRRLVGFSAVGKADVDFRDSTFAARIGAKRGDGEDGGGAPARD